MKRLLIFIIFSFINCSLYASHIIGGEITYDYVSEGSRPNTNKYNVYLRLFRDCDVACGIELQIACLPDSAIVSIFANDSTYQRVKDLHVFFKESKSVRLNKFPECISTRPSVCYEVKIYTASIELPVNEAGYILSYQNCCRAKSFNVVDDGPSRDGVPGVTFDCIMPGTNVLPTPEYNSSALFTLRDPALVCYSSSFTINYSATDADGDSLSYSFEPGFSSGYVFLFANDTMRSGSPEFPLLDYHTENGYTGTSPLGDQATINPVTGVISGIAPAIPGRYVVNVVVKEWRHGIVIGEHRKDFILRVENCTIPRAELKPSYITCDGFNLTFQNESTSSNINSYYWDFGDTAAADNNSTEPMVTHTYADSGTYTVTLITNKDGQCTDKATTIAKVYPGFVPDFIITGSCYQVPFTFTDITTSKYGKVEGWRWNFGDQLTEADTSLLKNPSYQYSSIGDRDVSLIVSNSKGCTDTVYHTAVVKDKPDVILPFSDTLICSIDSLQLSAGSDLDSAIYTWLPDYNIRNLNTDHPIVYPKTTTNYIVTVDDNKGCVNSDTVLVRVIDKVDLELGDDIPLCQGDTLQLRPATNGLYFNWTPATYIDNTSAATPLVYPPVTTRYSVTASVGKCSASDDVTIKVAPYPKVSASANDTLICYGTTTQLNAEIVGSSFTWTPTNTLLNSATLSPVARPLQTTTYTIIVTDTVGCPKPSSANVHVVVIPPVRAFAGNDTIIVANQPLQLNATGGTIYTWSPATGMNNPDIENPLVILNASYDAIIYTVKVSTPEGCFAYDSMNVKIFKTQPEIFVPSAFTPNADGRNDVLKPIIAGMKRLNYFRVYNRWGQLVFSTTAKGEGWDGTLNGAPQPTGTFVYMAQAVDYTGQVVLRKGTVVLIR